MANAVVVTRLGEDDLGQRIYRIDEGFDAVQSWLQPRGGLANIRGHAVDEDGHHTFISGGGYDVVDADLLGGDGAGALKKQFERDSGLDFVLQRL